LPESRMSRAGTWVVCMAVSKELIAPELASTIQLIRQT
jgi:hypothetical protein